MDPQEDDEDNVTSRFANYEEFLDAQIQPLDMYYLEDEGLARQLVELGYRGTGEVLKREEFAARKQAAEELRLAKTKPQQEALSRDHDVSKSEFLSALAEREEHNRTGKMNSIVFIRAVNSKNQEISGYIDYASRLKDEDFNVYFSGKGRLLPKQTDLSFFNWHTQAQAANESPNFHIIDDHMRGLVFRNKKDRKTLSVNPTLDSPGDTSARAVVEDPDYLQIVFYDHVTRKN